MLILRRRHRTIVLFYVIESPVQSTVVLRSQELEHGWFVRQHQDVILCLAGERSSCRWPLNVKAAGQLHKNSKTDLVKWIIGEFGFFFCPVSNILLLNDPANLVQRVVYHWRAAQKPRLSASSDTPVQ